MLWLLIVAALAVSFGAAKESLASIEILYYRDLVVSQDSMAQALVNLGPEYNVTTVSSSSAFQTQIQSGNYALGIFFVQQYSSGSYTGAINALGAFVANGGKAIYTDWSRDSSLSLPNFGVGFSGVANETAMNVTKPEFAVGLTNPIQFSNPGWGIFTMGTSGGEIAAQFTPSGHAAIGIGMDGRAIVNGFLSDTFNGAPDGAKLFENEIHFLTNPPSTVPEPATIIVWSILGGLGCVFAWRRGKVA
jgi:hypothetical protein